MRIAGRWRITETEPATVYRVAFKDASQLIQIHR